MAVVYIDGVFYDRKEDAKISVWDHGLLYGDGIFEGIRVYGGRVFCCREHLDRLYDSARMINLEIPMDIDRLEEVMLETVRRSGMADCYIRLVITRGTGDLGIDPARCKRATIIIIVDIIRLFPKELYDTGVDVIVASTRKNSPESLNPCVKSLNYLNNIMAKMEASRAGMPEAIMMNQNGHVTEGTADNIFVVKDGVVRTPPASAGILIGITRNAILKTASRLGIPAREENMTRFDLYTADEIFLSGTAAEMIPVVSVDGRPVGDKKPGPVFFRLLEGLREMTETSGTPVGASSPVTARG